MKTTIAVLYGGRSGEHEVSCVSAASVARHLAAEKYDILLIGITQDGRWYLQDETETARCRDGASSLALATDENRRVAVVPGGGPDRALAVFGASGPRSFRADVAFPVLHGTFGEDGTVQGLFEMAGLPYVGAGVLGSAIGMDKDKSKALWIHAGLPVVPYLAVRKTEWSSTAGRTTAVEKVERAFGYPLFVKPACAGSSVGAGKAVDRIGLENAVASAFEWDDKTMIEPFVPAREIECSVTGDDDPVAYVPGEVAPTHEFYDYDAKYVDPNGAALLIPADLDGESLETVKKIAIAAYRAAELSGLARVDFFVSRDTGEILLNEVNTMPGFTSISMFPKMCEAAGLPYPALLDRVINLALARGKDREKRDYARKPATP